MEKLELQEQLALSLEAVLHQINERVVSGEVEEIDELKQALDTLLAERALVDPTPTWPWRPTAMRAFVSAILLPLVPIALELLSSRFF